MNPDKLSDMVKDICNKYNYPMPTSLTLNKRLRTTLGLCRLPEGSIELNDYVVRHNPKKVILALLKHEICHLRHYNHYKDFEVAVTLMGSALNITSMYPNIKLPFKYEYRCPNCHNTFYWDKRRNSSCGYCSPDRYNKKFKLRLVQ